MPLALGSALAQSETDLADFFENAAIALHWVDGRGIILRANRAELEFLGYAPGESTGPNIARSHAAAAPACGILARLTAGETLRDEPARMRARDGTLRH